MPDITCAGVGGVANRTFVCCLPGSTGACKSGRDEIIEPRHDFETAPATVQNRCPVDRYLRMTGMAKDLCCDHQSAMRCVDEAVAAQLEHANPFPDTIDSTRMPSCRVQDITGVVLAGGRGQRMQGADKGLLMFEGRPLIEHVISALRPQVNTILISANRNQDRYLAYGYPVIADSDGDFSGPLAGMARGMASASTQYILAVPCDAPRIPATLSEGLYRALVAQHAGLAVAHDGTRLQPVFALLRCTLLPELQIYLAGGGRRVDAWTAQQSAAPADFSAQPEAFLNLNSAADLPVTETGSHRRTREP